MTSEGVRGGIDSEVGVHSLVLCFSDIKFALVGIEHEPSLLRFHGERRMTLY